MKLIKDIRLMESSEPNEDYYPTPYDMGKIYHYDHLESMEIKERVVFYLRSLGMGFADFDHLYINFTPLIPHGEVRKNFRPNIREFSWFRYMDAGCDPELFNGWELREKTAFVLNTMRTALALMVEDEHRETVTAAFDYVLEQGEKLELPYKHKENEYFTVDVHIRITDDLDYIPVVTVKGKDGTAIVRKELPAYARDALFSQFSSFSLGIGKALPADHAPEELRIDVLWLEAAEIYMVTQKSRMQKHSGFLELVT